MSDTEFTPGPWFVHDFTELFGERKKSPISNVTVSCSTPDSITVANMGSALTGTVAEALANANLIAAAPDLYDALTESLAFAEYADSGACTYCGGLAGINIDCRVCQWHDKATAALAKARGEAQP